MGREVRKVPADWQHPKDKSGRFKPLMDGRHYKKHADEWLKSLAENGLQATLDYEGNPPNKDDYMPDWSDAQRTHLMMYEDTSEGTPISPAFKTPEELARWLTDSKASSFGSMTGSYEGWLRVANGGFAPSMVIDAKGTHSGVDGLTESAA